MKLSCAQKIGLVVLMAAAVPAQAMVNRAAVAGLVFGSMAARSVEACGKAAEVAALEEKLKAQQKALEDAMRTVEAQHAAEITKIVKDLDLAKKQQLAEQLTPFYEDLVKRLQDERENKTACSWGVPVVSLSELDGQAQCRVDARDYQCHGLADTLRQEKGNIALSLSNLDKAKRELLGIAKVIAEMHQEIWKSRYFDEGSLEKNREYQAKWQKRCDEHYVHLKRTYEQWLH